MAKRICVRVASSLMNERRMAAGAIESTVRTSLAVGSEPVICEVIDATLVELTSCVPCRRAVRASKSDIQRSTFGWSTSGASTISPSSAEEPATRRSACRSRSTPLSCGTQRSGSDSTDTRPIANGPSTTMTSETIRIPSGRPAPAVASTRVVRSTRPPALARRCRVDGVGRATRAQPASGGARRRTPPPSRRRATRRSRGPWGRSTFAARESRPRLRWRPP